MLDRFKRPLRDLRISVTDRCNFRCGYCMPAEIKFKFLPRTELLSFEEIAIIAAIFARHGVEKLRLTGGEPLLRRDLDQLIKMLAGIEGIRDIALTTNGFFLEQRAESLKEAGLDRVTVSFDSLDPETFASLNGKPVHPDKVLGAIDAAADAGLEVKINTVVQRGVNDHEITDLAALFRKKGHTLRFIEFMDVGNVNGWNMEKVVPSREVRDHIQKLFPCEPMDPNYSGEVANRWRYLDGHGEFGLISSVTEPFCGGCTGARLSADGELFTCLFAGSGVDLKNPLREENGQNKVTALLEKVWTGRDDAYSQKRSEMTPGEKVEMFKIGG